MGARAAAEMMQRTLSDAMPSAALSLPRPSAVARRGTSILAAMLLGLLGACEPGDPTAAPTPPATLTGVWRAANDGNRLWGDSIALELTQVDTALVGRYRATNAGSRGSYGGAVTGWRSGSATTLGLTYDPREHGCMGPERSCFRVYLRFDGALDAQGRLAGTLDDQLNRWPVTFVRASP